jgi:hypothetical protein
MKSGESEMDKETVKRIAKESGFSSDYFEEQECDCEECNFLSRALEKFAKSCCNWQKEKDAQANRKDSVA